MATKGNKHKRASVPSRSPRPKGKPGVTSEPRKKVASAGGTPGAAKGAGLVSRLEVGRREKHPGRPEQTPAFFADARHAATDALAEELGESFVLSATCGEDPEEHYERELPEEEGGPFLETTGRTEFAYGVDESNPEDAEPAPWPAVSPGQPPPHRPGGPR
jgi:hypothetical protein